MRDGWMEPVIRGAPRVRGGRYQKAAEGAGAERGEREVAPGGVSEGDEREEACARKEVCQDRWG